MLVAATAEIVLDGAIGHSPLIPKSPHIAAWLRSLGGERLGYRVFLIALLSSTVAYVVLLGLARTRPRARAAQKRTQGRWAIALVALLSLIVFAGPILISTDVFSYIAYVRMGVVHGVNPYLHGPAAIAQDPVFYYVGHDWLDVATAYGPLYTLISYPLAPLGLVGALWGMKVYAQLASLATLTLTWRVAARRGFDPVFALLAVGANPLYVIYGLGGAHNDLIMLALMMAAVALTIATPVRTRISGRAEADDRSSPARLAGAGAAVIAGALVKATVAVLLPFMLADRRRARQGRLAILAGALAALVLGLLAGYLAFGSHGVNLVAALNRDSAFVSTDSFPNELAHLFGKPGVFPVDHDLLKAALALILVYLLWRTWHGYDWVAASGWALLAISVTSTWLLAWYILWPLPLAVVARDRRLLLATLFVQGLFVIHQTSPLLAP
ncbi:MAG TPA: glycosyltransferase 87 family protein, partial [Solirubrobacteraceae bacterium]|nr:glycosyltransferase 87 family protein [Solirubrobacteraceae bacterium]